MTMIPFYRLDEHVRKLKERAKKEKVDWEELIDKGGAFGF
jgi:hypothetical protein